MNSKRTKRRAIAVLATCFSTSCVLIAGAPSLLGETQSNPFVSQRTANVGTALAVDSTDTLKDKKAASGASQIVIPATNMNENAQKSLGAGVSEATVAVQGSVQSNRFGAQRMLRPTRLPAVAKQTTSTAAVSKTPAKRPRLLPAVKVSTPMASDAFELPSSDPVSGVKVPIDVLPNFALPTEDTLPGEMSRPSEAVLPSAHALAGEITLPSDMQFGDESETPVPEGTLGQPTKQLDASDYVLPELGQAAPMPVIESVAAETPKLDLSPPAINTFAVESSIAPKDLPSPEVELDAPRVSLSPSPRIDSKRPIRPVEVSRKSVEPSGSGIPTASKLASSDATALQSIGAAPRSSARKRVSVTQTKTKNEKAVSTRSSDLAMNWLPSTTSTSSQQDARRNLDQAMREYTRKAWASAEASAWESLTCSAEGIDIARRDASFGTNRAESSALNDLQTARTAIRESRDFAGKYGPLDSESVSRIVLSHTTEVLKNQSLQNVPPIDATDRYLNEARVRLASLAKYRVEAAQALDLLAAIHLGRNDDRRLPSQTALCFRRAALQGQPGNGSLAGRLGMHLAAVGLDREAKWALQHAIAVEPTREVAQALDVVSGRENDRAEAIRLAAQMQSRLPAGYEQNRGPVPTVVQLTPRQFASASKSHLAPKSQASSRPSTQQQTRTTVSGSVLQDVQTAPVSIRQTAAVGSLPSGNSFTTTAGNEALPSSEYESGVPQVSSDPAYYKTDKPKSRVRKMMDSAKFWR